MRRRDLLGLAMLGVLAVSSSAQSRAPAPLPPPRPPSLETPAVSPQPSKQQQPAPVPKQSAPEEPLDPDHPPMLPSASRAKMRECGRAWEAAKRAGKDGNIGWRAFATDCLTR
jgi:hypothetical protein